MIDTSNLNPLFGQILAEHFFQPPCEDIDRTVKPQERPTRNEDYLEHHESREDLGERYNGGYGRSRF